MKQTMIGSPLSSMSLAIEAIAELAAGKLMVVMNIPSTIEEAIAAAEGGRPDLVRRIERPVWPIDIAKAVVMSGDIRLGGLENDEEGGPPRLKICRWMTFNHRGQDFAEVELAGRVWSDRDRSAHLPAPMQIDRAAFWAVAKIRYANAFDPTPTEWKEIIFPHPLFTNRP